MWLEAILTREDLEGALRHLSPFTLELGAHGSVRLEVPTAVTLVDGRGLRVTCPAVVHGSLFGVDVPLDVHSVGVLLEPKIATRAGGDVLVFHVTVEALDVTALPHIVERAAVDAVNAALAEPHAELCWDFRATLSNRFALPAGLAAVPWLELSAFWGDLRVTPEALVFVVSFRDTPPARTRPLAPAARPARTRARPSAGLLAATACVALFLGVASVAVAVHRTG